MKQNTKSRNKFMKWLGLGVLGLALLWLAFSLASYFQQVQTNERLKTDIESTHAELAIIAKDLSKQTGMTWKDGSECYRLKPRLFGEDYKPICDVQFSAQEQSNIDNFTSMYENTKINGRMIEFGDAADLQSSLLNTAGFNLGSSLHENHPCVISYAYLKDKREIHAKISCYYEVEQATFDFITAKNVLAQGEDRF